jgi:hypothetical protein
MFIIQVLSVLDSLPISEDYENLRIILVFLFFAQIRWHLYVTSLT